MKKLDVIMTIAALMCIGAEVRGADAPGQSAVVEEKAGATSGGGWFFKPSLHETLGSNRYVGSYADVTIGGDLRFKPSYNQYHSAAVTGTYRTIGLRIDYDVADYTLSLRGGVSPSNDNYRSRSAGGDVSRLFDFEATEGNLQPKTLELTASLTIVNHHERIYPPPPKAGKPPPPAVDLEIAETDVHGGVATDFSLVRLGLDLTQSVYSQDISAVGARSAQIAVLSGLNSTVQGFPDLNAALRCDLVASKQFSPYVMYSYTKFKATQPQGTAYTFGAVIDWKPFSLDGSFERYAQRGNGDANYVSFAASYKFGL